MKLTHYIYICTALAALTACSDDDIDRIYTVGEADNAIVLRAGVNEGEAGVQTRAGAEGNHAKHVAFAERTQIALRIDGTWTGHDPVDIKQKTVATLGAASVLHNPLTAYSPVLYWDDYGTADPANAGSGKGREKGLTIYGAAVNGKTELPSTLSVLNNTSATWTSLSWNVGTPTPTEGVIDQTTGWGDYDLLTSNNVTSTTDDGTYKFDERNSGKLLEFTHAMTKITVNLTAGKGFPGYTEEHPEEAKFEAAPMVTLEGFYYQGTVDVEHKTSTPSSATADIKMYRSVGGMTNKVTFDAMVFPGKAFLDTDQILTLEADGNTFVVTAAKLNAAIHKAIEEYATTGYPTDKGSALLQARNYKLLITVNKTDLKIEATIADWDAVEAKEEAPKIIINKSYGHTGAAFEKDFDFFRSLSKTSGYSNDAWVGHAESAGTHTYTFHDQLYWPDHQTHYFFRGVFPRVQTSLEEAGWIPSNSVTYSTIAVANAAYQEGTYPSDLALGWPRTTDDTGDDETCKVHTSPVTQGICATEGNIYMNFRYVMSKVQVSLKSSEPTDNDYVDLSHADVKIIAGTKSGKIRLSDGLHEDYIAGDKGDYTLNNLSTPESGFAVTTLDAVVPQEIDDDVKIRIFVKDVGGNVLDVYEAQLNQIAVKNTTPATLIGEWKPGTFYKYQLDIRKTAIKVTATLTDWVTVDASQDVWF